MPPKLPLPRGWKRRVRSSVLHLSTAHVDQYTATMTRASIRMSS